MRLFAHFGCLSAHVWCPSYTVCLRTCAVYCGMFCTRCCSMALFIDVLGWWFQEAKAHAMLLMFCG